MTWASKPTSKGALFLVLAASTIACELVLGIGDQPHLADAGGGDAEGGTGTCALPSTGDAKVRIANLVPALATYDFCLTPSGSSPPPNGVLASSGSSCPPGLLYRNVLAPFAVPSGVYKIDVIAPGTSCSSTPLATEPSVSLDPQTTTTVVLFGTDNGAQLQLKSFLEETGTVADPKIRFANAWSDGPSTLECGVTNADEIPTTIISAELFAQNTPYASIAPQSAKVDANGYFTLIAGATFPFGFSPTGQGTSPGGVVVSRALKTVGSISTFSIGTTADVRFPVDLMICNQDQNDGIYTRCSNSVPDDVIANVYNTQLDGRFTPTEADRRVPVANAVAAMDSDFACITEVWDPNDQQAIINAAKTHFPFSLVFKTDLTTPATDPRDQQGNVPPPYTTAACSASGDQTNLNALVDCVSASCNTSTPNDPNGQMHENATPCVVGNCFGQGAALLNNPSCYACALDQLESGLTFANVKSECTTNPLARYTFGGNSGVILLSTHAFMNGGSDAGTPDGGLPSDDSPGYYVFPSTEYRAGFIRAPVDIGSGVGNSTKLDIYCAIFTTPSTSAERPYSGLYGNGAPDSSSQWVEEQKYQAKQLDNFVKTTSGARKRRAIVLADTYAGGAIGNLQALNQPTYDTLTQVLPLALAVDQTPQCTFCGTNPIVAAAGDSNAAIWSSYALLSDLAVPETQSNTVIIKELTAQTDPSAFGIGDGGLLPIPPSFYYGMRTVIRVRP
jgi:hypothetical protein